LKSEQATLDAVLSNMSDGAILVSRDGSVELINEAALGLFDVQQVPVNHPSLIEVIRNHQSMISGKKAWLQGRQR